MLELGQAEILKDVLPLFDIDGTGITAVPYGNGHINRTYFVRTDTGREYILQRINRHVFRDIPGLMENIADVTAWLGDRVGQEERVLTLVPAREGASFAWVGQEAYRMYVFVPGHIVLEKAERAEDLRTCAWAFGRFLSLMRGFPAGHLHEVIPHFHDPANRLKALEAAGEADRFQRVGECEREADLLLARRQDMELLTRLRDEGVLPVRVTHNDTKVNNVLLDQKRRGALCVVDLDTVMPGLAGYDFGDTARSGASLVSEDGDPERTAFSTERFAACAEGFLSACGPFLTREEKETLPDAARIITLELAARFLTDYLEGDVYFRTSDPKQNLRRARTQLKLAVEMEKHMEEMRKAVQGR